MSCLSGLKRESCESSDIEMSKWSLFVFWGRDLNERFVGKALLLNLGKATFRRCGCASINIAHVPRQKLLSCFVFRFSDFGRNTPPGGAAAGAQIIKAKSPKLSVRAAVEGARHAPPRGRAGRGACSSPACDARRAHFSYPASVDARARASNAPRLTSVITRSHAGRGKAEDATHVGVDMSGSVSQFI